MPDGVSNGNGTRGERRAQVIARLANGETDASVARRCHIDRNTVGAIRRAEFGTIQRQKELAAARAQQIAEEASQQMLDELVRLRGTKHRLHPTALVPVYGVAIDKMLALRGDAVATIQHLHTHRMSQDDVYAFALERSKHSAPVIEAQVVDSPPLLANGDVSQNEATNAPISDQSGIKTSPETHRNPDARARKKRRRKAK